MNNLLRQIGRGSASVATAAAVARSAKLDGLSLKAVEALASLGADGEWTQNQERDLHRWLRGVWNFRLGPYTIQLPLEASWFSQVCELHECVR